MRLTCSRSARSLDTPVGAGTGLAGLAAAALGAKEVFLSDLGYAVRNLAENVRRSFAEYMLVGAAAGDTRLHDASSLSADSSYASPDGHRSITVGVLDWADPGTYRSPQRFEVCTPHAAAAPQGSTSCSAAYAGAAWDVIIGADIVWVESLVPPLVDALVSMASTNSLVILSHQVSRRLNTTHTGSCLFLAVFVCVTIMLTITPMMMFNDDANDYAFLIAFRSITT